MNEMNEKTYFAFEKTFIKTNSFASDRYVFCQKCFNDIPGDTVTLGDDPMQSST